MTERCNASWWRCSTVLFCYCACVDVVLSQNVSLVGPERVFCIFFVATILLCS